SGELVECFTVPIEIKRPVHIEHAEVKTRETVVDLVVAASGKLNGRTCIDAVDGVGCVSRPRTELSENQGPGMDNDGCGGIVTTAVERHRAQAGGAERKIVAVTGIVVGERDRGARNSLDRAVSVEGVAGASRRRSGRA